MNFLPAAKKTKTRRPKAPKWQKRDFNLEARFQAAIVEYLERVLVDALVYHIPNGGPGRSLSRLKWMGAKSGITDLVIVDEHGLSYFAEVKPPDGQLSDDQIEFRDLCRKRRWPWAQWTTINDAQNSIAVWGIRNRDAMIGGTT